MNLEEIESKWLKLCGSCDLGLPEFGCTCPVGDFRPDMARLVREVQWWRDRYVSVAAERAAMGQQAVQDSP